MFKKTVFISLVKRFTMKFKFISLLLFLTCCLQANLSTSDKPKTPEIKRGFIENKGQVLDQNKNQNTNVKFLLNQSGLNVHLTKSGFSYDTYKANSFHRIDIEFVNGNKHPKIIATEELPGYTNYYLPEAPNGAALNIHSYKKVVYKNIYPNIDIEFFLNEKLSSGFEYNFVLRSGSNIGDIKLKYKGANKVELTDNKIKVTVAHGAFTEEIPKSFIIENGQEIKTYYSLVGKNTFGFLLPQKNISLKGKTLIIDPYPVLTWGTYYGGSGYEYLNDMKADASGNIIVGGYTSSTLNIATVGAYQTTLSNPNMDGFLAKFNSSGVIQWATYYGGNCDVQINGIATDNSSNIYFTGQTCANTGISTPGTAQPVYGGSASDAFLVKFSPAGTRTWGTYCGGGSFDWGYDVAIDGSGNIYLGGGTSSSNGIATFGVYQSTLSTMFSIDAFITKYNPSGAKLWGTYYGGTGDDYAYGIAVTAGGPVIVGSTASTGSISSLGAFQPAFGGGSQDGFIALLDANGNFRTFGTYYGGSGNQEKLRRVNVDGSGNILVTGEVGSTGLSTVGSFQPTFAGVSDCIIAKFNGGGGRTWATYFGDVAGESGWDIALDASNNVYVTGNTTGKGSIMSTPGTWQQPAGCNGDAFIIKLNSSGARQWSTLYGDQGQQYGTSIAVSSGSIFVAGNTSSLSTVLATAGAYQSVTGGGTMDAFIATFTESAVPNPTLSAINGPTIICGSNTYTYSISSPINTAGSNYQWNFPWSFISTSATTVTTSTAPIPTGGTLTVYPACDNSISSTLAISAIGPLGMSGTIAGSTLVCNGTPTTYSIAPASNATYYIWSLPSGWTGTSTTNIINTIPGSSGNVSVTAGNYCGTLGPVTKSITVSSPQLTFTPVSASCNGVCDASLTFTAGGGMPPYTYTPSSATNLCAGMYTVYATDNMGCNTAGAINVPQPAVLNVSAVNVNSVTCNGLCNGSFSLNATGGTSAYSFSPAPLQSSLCSGVYNFTVTDANSCTSSSSVMINEPSPLNSSITPTSMVICDGNSSTLTAGSSGGTGPVTYSWSTSSSNSSIVVSPTATTTYSLDVTDVNSCTTSSQITITVNPSPTVTISGPTSPICSGNSACLSASGGVTYSWSGPCGQFSTFQNPCFPINGTCGCTFTVVVNNSFMCYNSATFCIATNPNPTVSAVTSTSVLCTGQTSTLTANGALTYSWSTSATGSATAVSPTTTTSYTVTGTDANGCMDTDTITQYISACTGISSLNKEQEEIKVFPNPFNDKITVAFYTPIDFTFQIYNSVGSVVYSGKMEKGKTEIDLSYQSAGIYFIKAGSFTKKIIKH